MSECSFFVSLTPKEVKKKIENEERADLVYDEFHDIGNGKYYGTLIFEKFFMRVSNSVALTVLFNNLNGKTQVTAVSTGSSPGGLFNFDWGAAEDFAYSIKELLENYIIN